MRKQKLPTDHWIERFADWLDVQGLLASETAAARPAGLAIHASMLLH